MNRNNSIEQVPVGSSIDAGDDGAAFENRIRWRCIANHNQGCHPMLLNTAGNWENGTVQRSLYRLLKTNRGVPATDLTHHQATLFLN
jgi:hypothetical protein